MKLTAVPEKGKANEELRALLADFFGVAKTRVEIVAGRTSAHNRITASK